jgi:hypothetical protein
VRRLSLWPAGRTSRIFFFRTNPDEAIVGYMISLLAGLVVVAAVPWIAIVY